MLSPSDREFQKLVLQLLRKFQKSLTPSILDNDESHLDVEIKIPSLGPLTIRITITSTVTARSQEEPDPRLFGDSQAVVATAMQNWHPGKVSSWTEHRRSVSLQATNLPDTEVDSYTATYEYDPSWMNEFSECYEVEQIYKLLVQLLRTHSSEKKTTEEKNHVDKLRHTFKKLMD